MPNGSVGPVVPVYLEAGTTRVFACALDWPGWCRRAKADEEALDALAAYAPRYAVVAKRAGLRFPAAARLTFDVVEQIPWTGGKAFSYVDFGALGVAAALDSEPLTAAQAKRLAALVEASWAELDDVVAGAPAELQRGPRGGGRDRDAVFAHVLGAEAAYARKLGVRHAGIRQKAPPDRAEIAAARAELLAALSGARAGEPPTEKGWLPRYAARRIAWHVLDHAWEIQDRS
ncbi:MAG TPA: hypothetical protein VGL75_14380 [Acidothermaceae bacterium]|jgi:hypothetical protein